MANGPDTGDGRERFGEGQPKLENGPTCAPRFRDVFLELMAMAIGRRARVMTALE